MPRQTIRKRNRNRKSSNKSRIYYKMRNHTIRKRKSNNNNKSRKKLKGGIDISNIPLNTIITNAVDTEEFKEILEKLPYDVFNKLKGIIDNITANRLEEEEDYSETFEEDDDDEDYHPSEGSVSGEEEELSNLINILDFYTKDSGVITRSMSNK